ncbi:MAG: NIPSNAP family protein [Chitinophagaceae bacterium]
MNFKRTANICRLCLVAVFVSFGMNGHAVDKKPAQEFYEIKIYHFKTADQERELDNYLKLVVLPALHKNGISKSGVFKPLANDTAADKIIYLFTPLQSFEQFLSLPGKVALEAARDTAGGSYTNAAYNNAPYTRTESILLKAFKTAPAMQLPALTGDRTARIYELRSYESATEKLYQNKVHMFNEGGEVPLFKRLAFNAVFYAEVIAGSHMPNLMYMTSFDNMASRDAHWKTFSADAAWKELSARPEYQHNVSKAEITLLRAAAYSDIF